MKGFAICDAYRPRVVYCMLILAEAYPAPPELFLEREPSKNVFVWYVAAAPKESLLDLQLTPPSMIGRAALDIAVVCSLEKIDRIIGIFEWAVKFSESEDVRERALLELGSLGRALLLQGQSKVSEPLSNNPAPGTDGEGGRESAASASQALRQALDTAEQEQQELPSSIEEYDDHRDEKEQTS